MCSIPIFSSEGESIFTQVSDEDYAIVSKYKWHARAGRNTNYVQGRVEGRLVRLHKFLLGFKEGFVIDHKDRDGLNNTRENLHFVSNGQNAQNSRLRGGTSEFRGVSWNTAVRKWHVKCGGEHFGYFDDEDMAGSQYDRAVLQKYGQKASTNFFYDQDTIECITRECEGTRISKLLPIGVTRQKDEKTYKATLTWDQVTHHLGRFRTVEEARKAYLEKHCELSQTKLARHHATEIVRNADGIAKIDIYNKIKVKIASALVCDEDWHRLCLVKWSLSDGYVVGYLCGEQTSMHKAVLSTQVVPGLVIDHVNRNRLDNRRENLRAVTPSQNSQNRKSSKNITGYVGVERKKNNSKWSARIHKDYIEYRLGSFDHPILAAVAYNIEALKLYDLPYLNTINNEQVTCMMRANEIVLKDKSSQDISKIAEAAIGMTISEGSTSKKREGTASRFKGVTKSCGKNRWNAEIRKNGQRFKLGTFDTQEAAALAYNAKAVELYLNPRLNVINEADTPPINNSKTSKYRGVSWSKKYEKWIAQFRHEKQNYYIGSFTDEIAAARAINRKCKELIAPESRYNDVSDNDEDELIPPTLTSGIGQKKRPGSTQFKGVSATQNKTFAVEFNWKNQRHRGGTYKTQIEAARRYNELALEVTKDEIVKPRLNIIPEDQ